MIGGKIKFNFDAAKFDKELTLDELRERNRKQVQGQLELQKMKSPTPIEQAVGNAVLNAIS